jgi:hypothetical protein
LHRHLKAIFVHCRDIRRHATRQQKKSRAMVRYPPLNAPWSAVTLGLGRDGSWPGGEVRVDSSDLYRIALQEVFWPWWVVPDGILSECLGLWRKPHQAALAVLATRTKLSPAYLERRIYTNRRTR